MSTLIKTCLTSTILAFLSVFVISSTAFAATSPTLGAVGSYSVLGHTTITNTGATTMPGDLGISIGGAPVGFPPGVVGPPGTIRNAADSLAAQNANTAAFGFIDQPCTTTYAGTMDLVGLNLVPGVYCADAFRLTGVLTLNGNPDDVWIFKSASDLITSTGGSVATVTGGNPCNVWWRVVSSATIGTDSVFVGNILASTSVSLQTNASLNGRALSQTGQVSLDTNTITGSACLTSPVKIPGLPNTATATHKNDYLSLDYIVLVNLIALPIFYTIYKLRKHSTRSGN